MRAKDIENIGYKLFDTGKDKYRNGVGVVVAKHLKDSMVKEIGLFSLSCY